MKDVLAVEDLAVVFPGLETDVQAVRGVSWSVGRGECLGIVGESGSGKSVSVWAALGLLGRNARRTGRIFLDGRDAAVFSEEEQRRLRGAKLAMIFQEPSRSFDPIYNLEKTFLETFRAHDPKVDRAVCRDRTVSLLREVHIPNPEGRLKSFPHQFSGGMLQRVMIALALANSPEVLVCDEPTTALDVTIQAQIVELLRELKEKRGLALVFISHDLNLVGSLADRVLVMYGGLVLESGPTEAVLADPISPYTRALWNARLPWGHRWDKHPLSLIPGTPPDPTRPEPGCPFAPRCSNAEDDCRTLLPVLESRSAGRVFRCFHPEAPR